MKKLFSENNFFEHTCSLISHVHISEINISAVKKVQLEKLQNILKMDSSDKEVLLESSCFLLNYHQEQIKSEKEKVVGASARNISGNFYNKLFSESSEEKCTNCQGVP